MTIRQLISSIRNELNTIGLDDRKSNRFIFSKFIFYSDNFIRKEADTRRLFNNQDIFKKEKIDLVDYKNFNIPYYLKKCSNLKQSKTEIYKSYSSIYSNLIIISSLDDSKTFNLTSPEKYKDILNREFKSKDDYYWIENNNIIIPNIYYDSVNIRYIPKLSLNLNHCNSLDETIYFPEWLIADIIKFVVQDIRNSKAIIQDENPDLNNNSK